MSLIFFTAFAILPLIFIAWKFWLLRNDIKKRTLHTSEKFYRGLYLINLILALGSLYLYWACLWPNQCASDWGEGLMMIASVACGFALTSSIIIEFSFRGFAWAKHLVIYAIISLMLTAPLSLFLVFSRFQ